VFPGHDPEPNHVPLGLVGPGTERTAAALERGGRFEPKRYEDEERAREAILDREVYGAVLTGPRPRLLVAGAASAQVASLLQEAAGRVSGGPPPVEDVRPLAGGDPRGVTINLIAIPLSVTSILGAMLLFVLAPALAAPKRLACLAGFAVVGGLVTILIVAVAIDALPGPFLGLSAVAALVIAATAVPSALIVRLLGPPGIMLSFLVFLMFGNPASGAASAPELLPDPWREGGQLLPAGAGATGLRNVAYFDGAALAQPLLVLIVFAAAGAALMLATARRTSRSPTARAPGTG
jgi:hypothetical protein